MLDLNIVSGGIQCVCVCVLRSYFTLLQTYLSTAHLKRQNEKCSNCKQVAKSNLVYLGRRWLKSNHRLFCSLIWAEHLKICHPRVSWRPLVSLNARHWQCITMIIELNIVLLSDHYSHFCPYCQGRGEPIEKTAGFVFIFRWFPGWPLL